VIVVAVLVASAESDALACQASEIIAATIVDLRKHEKLGGGAAGRGMLLLGVIEQLDDRFAIRLEAFDEQGGAVSREQMSFLRSGWAALAVSASARADPLIRGFFSRRMAVR
jgi:hypothetical protein